MSMSLIGTEKRLTPMPCLRFICFIVKSTTTTDQTTNCNIFFNTCINMYRQSKTVVNFYSTDLLANI